MEKRFIRIYLDRDGSTIGVDIIDEAELSRSVDMSDCDPFYAIYSYVDGEGKVHPVSFGEIHRTGGDWVYGYSDVLADGQVVAHINHTDH